MYTLWYVSEPKYDWRQSVFLNGEALSTWKLPCMHCPIDGPIGFDGTLPFECPPSLLAEMQQGIRHVSPDEFAEVAQRVREALPRHLKNVQLRPGYRFFPAKWNVPTIPRANFFWLLGSVIVSEVAQDTFLRTAASGVVFVPVEIGQVGRAEASDEPDIADCENTLEMIKRVGRLTDIARLGRFYEMLFTTDPYSSDPASVERCPVCGRRSFVGDGQEWNHKLEEFKKRKALPGRYAFDKDIFRALIPYSGFFVSNRLFGSFPKQFWSNCSVEQIRVVD